MKRSGLLLAAGIIGIVRGTLGFFAGLRLLPSIDLLDVLIPGIRAILYFELLLSIAILIVSIWVIVNANIPSSASAIKTWGGVIIAAGVVDLVWTISVVGNGGEIMASALGSLAALGLIGGLMVAGGDSLEKRA